MGVNFSKKRLIGKNINILTFKNFRLLDISVKYSY